MSWLIVIVMWSVLGIVVIRTAAWGKFHRFIDDLETAEPGVQVLGRRFWTIALLIAFGFGWPAFMLMPEQAPKK